jgi:hypothetical protein
MRADNTRHLIVAARQRHELTRAKAIQALRTLDAEGRPVTFEAVAQAAAVSRSWLYAQSDVRAEIERLRAAHRRAPATPAPRGNDPRTPHCYAGSKAPTSATGHWQRRTASSETNSPEHSASSAPHPKPRPPALPGNVSAR